MMDQLISRFPAQIESAIDIARRADLKEGGPFSNVYISGLGGSGIGANFVQHLVRDTCKVPIEVGKGYQIPGWIGKDTLAIVSSYSGNTEETISAFHALKNRGCTIVGIASGGEIIRLCREAGLGHILLPDNWPSPRACLGFSIVQQLAILVKYSLIPLSYLTDFESIPAFLNNQMDGILERAEHLARLIFGNTPVIYTEDHLEPVAVRWRQQINENAKLLCWHHVIPEMNHNELVGWRDQRNDLAVIFLRTGFEYPRNQVRTDLNKEIIGHYAGTVIEVRAMGSTSLEQWFYLVHLGDWISWYLAELRKVDANEVRVIDFLKSELAKIS